MSIFRYDSRHKVVTFFLVAAAAAIGYYLNQRGQPTFDNGQVKRTGSVVNWRNQGRWTWYYPDGRKKMEGDFAGGKRTGRWITFDSNGDTLTVSMYRNDQLNGLHTDYGPDGRPTLSTNYVNDKPTGPVDPATQ